MADEFKICEDGFIAAQDRIMRAKIRLRQLYPFLRISQCMSSPLRMNLLRRL